MAKDKALITLDERILRLGRTKANQNFQNFSQYLAKLILEDNGVER